MLTDALLMQFIKLKTWKLLSENNHQFNILENAYISNIFFATPVKYFLKIIVSLQWMWYVN